MRLALDHVEMAQACGGKWLNLDAFDDLKVKAVRTDSRSDCEDALFLALSGDNFDGHDFLRQAVEAGAAAFCVARARANLSTDFPAVPALVVDDTLTAYQALARLHRRKFPDVSVVGLTGSSGKTSAKEMLRAIFAEFHGQKRTLATEGNTNNQVGVPQNLLELNADHRVAIIEMGSNHPGEIDRLTRTATPDAVLITSIGPCHLEFFGDLNGVAREKASIINGLRPEGVAVIPADGPGSAILGEAVAPFNTIGFGTDDEADVQCVYNGSDLNGGSFSLILRRDGQTIDVAWPLRGAHQAVNAAGAAAVANALGVPPERIAAALPKVALPGFRSKVIERDGVTWINDAYNANPDSVRAGLTWLAEFTDPRRTFLALGDMLELGENAPAAHRSILTFAAESLPGAAIFAVGPMMAAAADGIEADPFERVEDAAAELSKRLTAGTTVYLKASRGMRLERMEP